MDLYSSRYGRTVRKTIGRRRIGEPDELFRSGESFDEPSTSHRACEFARSKVSAAPKGRAAYFSRSRPFWASWRQSRQSQEQDQFSATAEKPETSVHGALRLLMFMETYIY
jgi:hypothetical protein